jgi:hypothetical protein
MPLIKPIAPDRTRRALAAGVADYLNKGDPLGRALIRASQGLHVFTLRLQDVLAGEGIRGAKSAGWRFLAGSPLGPAIAGDVIEPGQGAQPKMTSVSRDPLISRAIRAIHEVETLPEVQTSDYELLVLRIPGLLVEAFWLKSRTGAPDLMVPVLTRSRKLEAMRAYALDDFMDVARGLAQNFLKFDELAESQQAD